MSGHTFMVPILSCSEEVRLTLRQGLESGVPTFMSSVAERIDGYSSDICCHFSLPPVFFLRLASLHHNFPPPSFHILITQLRLPINPHTIPRKLTPRPNPPSTRSEPHRRGTKNSRNSRQNHTRPIRIQLHIHRFPDQWEQTTKHCA